MGPASVAPARVPAPTGAGTTLATVPHFVGGKRWPGAGERTGFVYNPSTGAVAATVPLASARDVAEAVTSSERGFQEWSGWSPLRRARVLFRFRELAELQAAALAELIAAEHGKVVADALGEVRRGL